MTTHIVVTIILMVISVNSILFLKTYLSLLKFGDRTDGNIIAFDLSNHIMTKGLIPKLEFQTGKKQLVIGKPVYSWFVELNNYERNKNYVAYYNKNNPEKFVIKSNIEVLVNSVIVIGALVSLIWIIIIAV
jgi:hypothetical protein